MDSALSISLLGSPSIVLSGQPVRGFVSSKAAALLYYLAASGRPYTREALAGLLWPEVADAQALKNLRDVLSNLRRLLEPYLEITRQAVTLTSAAAECVDSRLFETKLARAEQARRQALERPGFGRGSRRATECAGASPARSRRSR